MNKLINKSVILIIFMLFAFVSVEATNYYVDAEGGSDSNNGTDSLHAWKTIAKVNSVSSDTSTIIQPGDKILFKRGQEWREQLNFRKSGTSGSRITIEAYSAGAKPIISGADTVVFQLHSGNIWKRTNFNKPLLGQVFFNDTTSTRGKKESSLGSLNSQFEWFYDSGALTLYIYTTLNPSTYIIEASVRNFCMYINEADYVTVQDLQVEKTSGTALSVSTNSDRAIVQNITFLQWTDKPDQQAGAYILGSNCILDGCTFGKSGGVDTLQQNWAGFLPVYVVGTNPTISNNFIYHNSIENENSNGSLAYGIRVTLKTGKTRINGNTIYHTGTHGIYITGNTNQGDSIWIHNNTIDYAGQAGISLWQTRGADGVGGFGFVYNNQVSFSNRLGGDAGATSEASGIHFNDGRDSVTNPSRPYIRWYCYDNVVRASHAALSNADSDGIALDYNANRVSVYRNAVYNNDGTGIYIWSADSCKVYYNIVFGNDAGITVSSDTFPETTNGNLICNNTFYHNYNSSAKGKNYNSEIVFGNRSNDSFIKNNIFHSLNNDSSYVYWFLPESFEGNIVDNNVVYTDRLDGKIDRVTNGNFSVWRNAHPIWDSSSVYDDPDLVNPTNYFGLESGSPAINIGVSIGVTQDYAGNPIVGNPDAGAVEYQGTPTELVDELAATLPITFDVSQNYPNPFNSSTTIKFSIPQDAHVTLKVFDILGNEVAHLINTIYPAGYYDINFDASKLATGIYIYRLKAGSFNRTMKMLLLK